MSAVMIRGVLSRYLPIQLLQPVRLLQTYPRENLRADVLAGLTVAVILIPQAIAFTLIADLPVEMGLYAAVIGAIIGGLWGSANQIHTGPANAISLLVASALITIAEPNSSAYILAAGMLAVLAGLFQTFLGLARLGVLVNFVSHSVIIGFTTGAGILIGIKQLQPILGVTLADASVLATLSGAATHLNNTHLPTFLIGVGTILLILVMHRLNPKLPGALIAMVLASAVVFVFGLNQTGVSVIGELPRKLPPLADLPIFDLALISRLSSGALAIAAIGLVQTAAISRAMAAQTGQRVDNNQEFVGQGLANIAAGLFSGYPISASFSRSAVNDEAGAKTPMAAIFSGVFALLAMFALAPLAAYLPLSALAGVLILTAVRLVDYKAILRIWRGARKDAIILIITLLGTLFLRLDFAVLAGILLSFAIYIMDTSAPRVRSVLPDEDFHHFVSKPDQPQCPQLGVLEIQGDLYFGAVDHVEESVQGHLEEHPTQRFLLIRMHNVNQIDFSGIHMLESVVDACRGRGGNVFMVRVKGPVLELMKSTGFYEFLGADHFLEEDKAIEHLFYKVLDPAVCIYESNVRIFRECQNLVRPDYAVEIPVTEVAQARVDEVPPRRLWQRLHEEEPPMVLDVREPREYRQGHIPAAQLFPLPALLENHQQLPDNHQIVLVCRSGRRSTRAARYLLSRGYENVRVLRGGMLNWEAQGLFEALGK
jgi:SulP family sulfate permease